MSLLSPCGEEGLSLPHPIETWILSPTTTRKVDADAVMRDYPGVNVRSDGVANAKAV
jgi:hypothetical protein